MPSHRQILGRLVPGFFESLLARPASDRNGRSRDRWRLRRRHYAAGTLLVFALGLLLPQTGTQAQTGSTFDPGTLIIPMDTDTAGNHASYNQNLGMWKAYGLVYRLLQNGIPVSWAIKNPKVYNDIDFTASAVTDKRTGTSLGSWSYRGGPFIIDSDYAAAAMPIIQAWWAAKGNQPNVHEATATFTANVDIVLRSAPRIANEAINSGISIAYYNAAGIPDLNGNAWTSTSPNILDQTEIAAGALFQQGVCTSRQFDIFVTPHNSGYAYSLTDPNNLGTRTYSQLDTFVHQGGGWTALCHSILSNENYIRDLTVNGSPAVKSLFMTSLPGGVPGGFLTTKGFSTISNSTGGGLWTIGPSAADLPVAQVVGTTVAQALPGGSVQTWPATGTGAPTYYAHTERVGYFDTATIDQDNIIAGTYHDGTGLGKLTYIGGHSFSTSLPYSGNYEAPYLRAFYNSLFFNGAAVAKLDLTYTPTTFPQGGTQPLYVTIENTGASTATNVANVTLTLNAGFAYVNTITGPSPTVSGQTLTWSSLGDIAGGAKPVTIELAVDTTIAATAGLKQFGVFHATYGDIYAEGFTADMCRAVEVSPVPAPSLTKTPATQGPVTAGAAVTWTLTYGNSGSASLTNVVLEDTLPPGFTYGSATPAPTIVIPGNPTIVRWNVGTLGGGGGGAVTVTALASGGTSGQVFTNHSSLTGSDAEGNPYSVSASAQVTVEQLPIGVGKTVDQGFLETLPGDVTYTIRPSYDGQALLTDARIIDPLPTGVTFKSAGQGGTFGAYSPNAAVQGVENDGTVPDSTVSLSATPTTLASGGTVTVTMTVHSTNGAVDAVTPDPLTASDGTVCGPPAPPSANLGNGGTITFTYTCTMSQVGEVTFTAAASGSVGVESYDFPQATSNSVLVSSNGAGNVVTWTLGTNSTAIDNAVFSGGAGNGIYAFRGSNSTTFWRYDLGTSTWSAMAAYGGGAVEEGGSVAYDGAGYVAGYIYGLRGNGTKSFQRYDIDGNSWAARADAPQNVGDGGAIFYLNGYVYAVRGAGKPDFWRYDPVANTWAAMTAVPANVNKGGALVTDGTNLYLTIGNGGKLFYRYNVAGNTWTRMADLPANVARGGALVRIGGYLYATVGNGSNKFYRYDIAANTWSAMAVVPGAVKDGGALTTDGTYIYALQGNNTKNFYRYTPSSNTWASLTLTPDVVKSNGGGALTYVPGNASTTRTTAVDAMRRLVVGGDTITVVATVTSTDAVSSVTPTLTISGSGGAGATCGSASPATLNLAAGVPGTFTYTCTATAGTTAGGSVLFKVSATGSGGATFAQATSNSVLVTPPLTFVATVPVGGPSQVVNAALLSASGQTVSSPPVTTNTGSSALTLTKSNSPPYGTLILPGDPIAYSVVVQNTGSGTATGVVVTDNVPANTDYASCTGGTSCTHTAGVVSWTIGSLAPGDTAIVTMSVNASTTMAIGSTPYVVTNTANGSSTQVPTPVASNPVSNQVNVVPSITKSVYPEQAATGDTLTYTLIVSNPGTTFTGTVSDPLPVGTSFVSCSPGPCSVVGGAVTWAGASIPPGTTAFTVAVTVTASGGSMLTNAAILDPTSPDISPIGSNQVDTPIGPELGLVKLTSDPDEVNVGDEITYTLLVSNQSAVPATDTVVTDALPAGTVFQSCTPAASCGQSGGVVTWMLGTLPADGDATLTFTVTVGTVPPGTLQINNTAQVVAGNATTPVDSNMVTNPVAGMGTLQLLLTKTATPTSFNAVGQIINYSYVLTNLGTATLHGFAVTDDKVTVTCPSSPIDIGPNQTITCTASYTIVAADLTAGFVTNVASASALDASNNPVASNQSSATVASSLLPISAVDDAGTASGTGGTAVTNVLANDTLNGAPVVPSQVTTTFVSSTSPNVTLVGTDVNVAPGTPAGTYTLVYQICEIANPTNCDTANVVVTVGASPIDAVDDAGTANGSLGGTAVADVLTNDTLNGVPIVPGTVTTTQVSTTNPGVALVGTSVAVAAGTPAGTYAVVYQICEVLNPGNCDTANVLVTVAASPIDAIDDTGSSVIGTAGGTSLTNVLTNDTLNGLPITPGLVSTTMVSSTNPGVTLVGTDVVVAAGTPAGNYTLIYEICELLNPLNCDQATVTVPVTLAAIDAVEDAGTANGYTGGTAVTNVLTNDTLNGVPVIPAQVTTTQVSTTDPNVTLVGTDVVVAPGTPAGTYTVTYQICETVNPTNCDTADVVVTVGVSPIDAVNDAGTPVIGSAGGTSFTDVLANDMLNGAPVVPGEVTLTFVSSTNTGVSLVGSDVVVAAGTPAGDYTLTYKLCEVLNPTNCDEAVVTVPVTAATIDAVNDAGTADGSAGGTAVTNVLANDTLNGVPVVPGTVTTTQVSTSNPNVTLSGTDVVVAPGTPAGTYTVVYQICEVLNPTNCDTANVIVTVGTGVIDAVNDAGNAINGATGGTSFTNVLGNDTLNGVAVNPSDVTLSFVSSTSPGVTLSGNAVIVAAGTPAGSYELVYQICEVLNPTNCDTAMVTVPVTAPPIDAVNDSGTANGTTGGTAVTNVLANDTLNGVAVVPGQVTTTQVSTTNPGVTLSGTNVVVAAGTPAGTYTLVYQICQVLNPANCDTANVTVTVTAAAPPVTTFGNPGSTTYDAATDLFSVTSTPLFESFGAPTGTKTITAPRGVSINILVDQTGALIGGTAGNDLTLTGTIPGTPYSGVLLTGEILGFSAQNVSTTDVYTLRFQVTGGALAPLYAGKDLIVKVTSENSSFTGSFATNFKGLAKGTIGPIAPLIGSTGGRLLWLAADSSDMLETAGPLVTAWFRDAALRERGW